MARKKMWVRHDKAASELGYNPGDRPRHCGARSNGSVAMVTSEIRTVLVVAAERFELKYIRPPNGRALDLDGERSGSGA